MTERPVAAVLGLSVLGASLAMALRQTARFESVIGWDPDFDVARQMQKLHVSDRQTRSAPEAVRPAAIVFLDVRAGQLRDIFAAIAPHLRHGAVVCNLGEAQEAATALADELLPRSVSFLSAHPVSWEAATGESQPSAALLRRGTLCISSPPTAHPDAIGSLAALAESLEMQTYFLGAREHDAFFSGVGRLPSILTAALLRVVTTEPSWRDLSRLAGGDFRAATAVVAGDPPRQQDAVAASREHLVRWLDGLLAELSALRDGLRDGREPEDYYAGAAAARQRWLSERQTPPEVADLPPTPSPPKRRLWL